jgi:GNAT superfamily N-acetyltransferase
MLLLAVKYMLCGEYMIADLNNLVRVEKSQVRAASEVLSRAFHDDPLFSSFIPDPLQRKNKLHYLLEMLVHYSVSYGEVYATSQNFEGVAVWLPSDRVEMTIWRGIRSGGTSIIINLGVRSTFRQLSVSDLMCSIHKRHIASPHWYLYLVGVEPTLLGKRYASNLVKAMLSRTDREGLACYLDNTNEKNLPMYQHFGFKVIEEYEVPKTGVNLWAMLREV